MSRDPRLDEAREALQTIIARGWPSPDALERVIANLGERCDTCEGEGEGAAEHWDGVWVRPKCPTCNGTGDEPAAPTPQEAADAAVMAYALELGPKTTPEDTTP